MVRQIDLVNLIRAAPSTSPDIRLSGEALEKAWKDWVQLETMRRYVFHLSLAYCQIF